MAAEAQSDNLVTILVNDVEVRVPKGELIVEAVKRVGIEIPIFCYHPRMKPVGMCRMCLVDTGMKQPDGTIRRMPKPQASCTLPASEGLAIYTDTESVHKDRRGVLEFLLINHPLDCPVCDKGGECPLQNNTLFYGPGNTRHVELKRHLPKAVHLSEYVTLDLERCIHCGRCVRFTEEISGDAQLAFRFRANEMLLSTFGESHLASKFSGNTIEICPVGALTSAKYRFRARPWDLETKPGICTQCSIGCSVWMDYRLGKFVRINGRTNEAVNEEWTCDRGKFGHDHYNHDSRLGTVLVRQGDCLESSTWEEGFDRVAKAFAAAGPSSAALFGPQISLETQFLAKKYFTNVVGTGSIDHRTQLAFADPLDGLPKTQIADLEHKPVILVFGTSLADELPIIYLRVRKAWANHHAKVVVCSDAPTEVDDFAAVSLIYRPGTAESLALALAGTISPADGESRTGVAASLIESAKAILDGSSAPMIATRNLYERDGKGAVEAGRRLAAAIGGAWNLYGLQASDEGAARLGIVPGNGGKSTREILEGCVKGTIKALWLVGLEPFDLIKDYELVKEALESVEFLAVQASSSVESVNYASVVLPACLPAEGDGHFCNAEGRVQELNEVLARVGVAKPGWMIFAELLQRTGLERALYSASDVFEWIGREYPDLSAAPVELAGAKA